MIYTIGHSNQTIERFLDLLSQHQITAVADVRSSPYSRRNPQFNDAEAIARLRRRLKIPENDMFRNDEQLSDEAYELQEQRIAYEESRESDIRAEIGSNLKSFR